MKFFGWLMFAGGGVVAFFGVVLLLVQAGMWLKDGIWTPMGLSMFWAGKSVAGGLV